MRRALRFKLADRPRESECVGGDPKKIKLAACAGGLKCEWKQARASEPEEASPRAPPLAPPRPALSALSATAAPAQLRAWSTDALARLH